MVVVVDGIEKGWARYDDDDYDNSYSLVLLSFILSISIRKLVYLSVCAVYLDCDLES